MDDPARTLGIAELADDYRPVPPNRWRQPWSGGTAMAMTALGALAVGFLIASGISLGVSTAEVQDARKQELISLIELRQERVDAMTEQLDTLRAEVAALEAEMSAPDLQRDVERIEQVAGLTAVRGPGLTVTLDDASGSCPSGQEQDCQIQDTDLQLAVNALFDAGAEAVAVNGERVIATTAIRSAGRAVLVNYRVLSPPYEILAVGDPEGLESGFMTSPFAIDFEIWERTYGLGFSVDVPDEVTLAPYAGSVRFQHAAPVEREGVGGG